MAEATTILERTDDFIREYKRLKNLAQLPDNKSLAIEIGVGSASTISNILGRRQNVTPEAWKAFREKYLPGWGPPPASELREFQNSAVNPMEIIERLSRVQENYSEGFKTLAAVMERIEKGMAQERTQAIIKNTVNEIVASLADAKEVELFASKHQDQRFEELLKAIEKSGLPKIEPSPDDGKKQDGNGGDGRTPRKRPKGDK